MARFWLLVAGDSQKEEEFLEEIATCICREDLRKRFSYAAYNSLRETLLIGIAKTGRKDECSRIMGEETAKRKVSHAAHTDHMRGTGPSDVTCNSSLSCCKSTR
ncbi:hypothetical protein CSA56_16515 [candidate division KSB3 bacterium]|uniref:Uncharacterized protein n=1 Tax=candidate division KSB3 bacterium TaxID=2044937 RepID=A0A2G6KB79_9BACT|nr:MAG: hypothetical protein CSA56_16515 [candidate division KSB3 bacterium]